MISTFKSESTKVPNNIDLNSRFAASHLFEIYLKECPEYLVEIVKKKLATLLASQC